MSKKLIAGAGVVASFAIALAPLATFATTAGTNPDASKDTLVVTVEKVCQFGYGTVGVGTHVNGTTTGYTGTSGLTTSRSGYGAGYGDWDSETNTAYLSTGTATTETAYGVMENATVNPNFAQSTLNIVCNNQDGYQITASAGNLAGTGSNSEVIAYSRVTPAATASTWSFSVAATTDSGTANDLTADAAAFNTELTDDVIAHSASATAATGDTITITYGVAVGPTLAADTYTGSVVYTLAQL